MSAAKDKYEPVNAAPVKSFFVSMLTRDINLGDAILDLLDNCVDGILRSKKDTSGDEPYKGFWAEIEFDKSSFTISDNCGGIPWSLHDYAFRMGNPGSPDGKKLHTVGVYGIGMKRAIFKMGEHCLLSTRNGKDQYEVEISPEWIADETDWLIPVSTAKKPPASAGTTIHIRKLHDGIAKTFGDGNKAFHAEFERRVATHYAFIISKGFSVKINRKAVEAKPTELVFAQGKGKGAASIKPFVFRAKVDGVEVFLTIGLTRPILTSDEVEQEDKKYSTLDAGWTVVCNDRAVVYCDRTELTGWGEDDIPRYHTQFIAISGIVEFRSTDAAKLPTTTTKRGIDASSTLYLRVKNQMREGLRQFTSFTYWWKGREAEARKLVEQGEAIPFVKVKQISGTQAAPLKPVDRLPGGQQFKPKLPRPRQQESNTKRISFERPLTAIRRVGEYVLDDADALPSKVGEQCFDQMLLEAKK